MKRKKWSEMEERSLITKYSELVQTKTLNKLKTREKKFKPIADHVNSVHHLIKPATFPFKWTWRDVSVKIQNMRHQFLGVKVKMRGEGAGLGDGNDYWENFGLYREVFGDLEIESGSEDGEEDGERVGFEVVKMREEVLRREERRREREDDRLRASAECATARDTLNLRPDPDVDLEMMWQKREVERRSRVERELRRRREVEERWEEEEMGWRERVVGMQLEHERQMMQMHSEFCHNQMQIIGTMARLVSQFFGAANDGLGVLPPHQVLGNLQHHSGGLGGDGKLDSDSPSEFL